MNYNNEMIDVEIEAARNGIGRSNPQQYDELLKNYYKIVDPDLRAPILQRFTQAYNEGAALRGEQPVSTTPTSPITRAAEAVRGQVALIPEDRQDLSGVMNKIRKVFATKAAGPLGQHVNAINAIAKE